MRAFRHGPTNSGRSRVVRAGHRCRLPREQLRGRAGQTVWVQKVPRPHSKNGGFRVPRRWVAGRLPRAVPELAISMPFIRLRRHRRIRVSTQSPFPCHVGRHTGTVQRGRDRVKIIPTTPTRNEQGLENRFLICLIYHFVPSNQSKVYSETRLKREEGWSKNGRFPPGGYILY